MRLDIAPTPTRAKVKSWRAAGATLRVSASRELTDSVDTADHTTSNRQNSQQNNSSAARKAQLVADLKRLREILQKPNKFESFLLND
jgi:hypothetical protein